MTDVYVSGTRYTLGPSNAIGKGGEADVYDIGGGRVLKLFKTPDHPDLVGMPEAQQAAMERIATHQTKLAAFPKGLPDRVIAPLDLATNKAGTRIVGYVMRFQVGTELLRYSERSFRGGIPNAKVVPIFKDLHATVGGVHASGVVIGDFNDLNVLVANGEQAFIVDADSMQFGKFLSMVYTDRFVDPLCCDAKASRLMLCRPHNAASDWYAFAVMLMQSLLFVDPYGGVYRPKGGTAIKHNARPLHRITVFHPDVKYPKPAVPYGMLSDDLLQAFHRVFEKDERGVFPLALIEGMRWTACTTCGTEHARAKCPSCNQAAPAAVVQTVKVRGTVTATRIFQTSGIILRAAMQGDKLRWLHHEGDAYKREDGSTVISGALDPQMRFRIRGDATVIGKNGKAVTLSPGKPPESRVVDGYGQLPVFDANERNVFWTQSDQLRKDGSYGDEDVGATLSGKTLFWVGSHFGLGFYRAGGLQQAFVFDAKSKGINDNVKLPRMGGKLVDASCAFCKDRAWLFTAVQEGPVTMHRVAVVLPDGTLVATAQAEAGAEPWMTSVGNGFAAGDALFAATDDGIVRLAFTMGAGGGTIAKVKEFPDTEPFVDSSTRLFGGSTGLIAVGQKEIVTLKIS
ncbi:MAG: hypothetical protein RLZZ324_1244 [Candidatus Parcubacteria bacterium]|jgi:hypothetical protein